MSVLFLYIIDIGNVWIYHSSNSYDLITATMTKCHDAFRFLNVINIIIQPVDLFAWIAVKLYKYCVVILQYLVLTQHPLQGCPRANGWVKKKPKNLNTTLFVVALIRNLVQWIFNKNIMNEQLQRCHSVIKQLSDQRCCYVWWFWGTSFNSSAFLLLR